MFGVFLVWFFLFVLTFLNDGELSLRINVGKLELLSRVVPLPVFLVSHVLRGGKY